MSIQAQKTTSAESPVPVIHPDAEPLAALLKAAGDPLRLQILRVLSNNAFGALELSDLFAMRQNAMSHHLKLMSKAGLINSRREGTHIFYRRISLKNSYGKLCEEIFRAADSVALPRSIQHKLDEIQESRAAASREFFRHNATKFREQQDLIASFPQYGEAVLATLDHYGPLEHKRALEVGPGEGDLLAGLCARFGEVIALDNSAEMLERARSSARRQNLQDIRFVLGDTSNPDLANLRADAISVNMVLHHTPAPAAIIADLAGQLSDDGVLVITELCAHDQDWARDACGDLWLGFEPDELSHWAESAGLSDNGSEFLALKNGFTIQIRQFIRSGANPPQPFTRATQP